MEEILRDNDSGFDYIVASDVIWLEYLVEPLVDTITWLYGHDNVGRKMTEMILGHERRAQRVEDKFFSLMKAKGFSVKAVPYEDMHPHYRSKDISIYRIFQL